MLEKIGLLVYAKVCKVFKLCVCVYLCAIYTYIHVCILHSYIHTVLESKRGHILTRSLDVAHS